MADLVIITIVAKLFHICPEMQVNEVHAFYDKHHKVCFVLKSHQNRIILSNMK